METNFPDVLRADESTTNYVEAAGKGKGLVKRARDYVRPIATRYVEQCQQQLLEVQSARRQHGDTTSAAAAETPTSTRSARTASTETAVATRSARTASTETAAATRSARAASTETAVATASSFHDDQWTTVFDDETLIQVEELDGTWRDATLFRSVKDNTDVCIWFGEDEYEGIDPAHPYKYCVRTEILEDDEGFDINWRMKSIDDDGDEDDDEDYSS